MKSIKVTLCPACGACPAVVITDEGVTIGEDENTVRLTHEQWNDLVPKSVAGEAWIRVRRIDAERNVLLLQK